jgi:hypothetical protein
MPAVRFRRERMDAGDLRRHREFGAKIRAQHPSPASETSRVRRSSLSDSFPCRTWVLRRSVVNVGGFTEGQRRFLDFYRDKVLLWAVR